MKWSFIQTKSGHVTVALNRVAGEFLLHSKYDPVKEAKRWVAQWEIEKHSPKKILVIGLGVGYHLKQLIQDFPHIPVMVWEFNPEYVEWLKNSVRLQDLAGEIQLCVSDDWIEIRTKLLPVLDDPETMVLLHSPSLELIPEKLTSLKELLENHVRFLRTIRRHADQLEYNFNLNVSLNDAGICQWKDKLGYKAAILVSAGPSLTKQLPILVDIHQKGLITLACVGTALQPLLNYGINPDIVMISDPQDNINEQFMKSNHMEPSLFYLATANHKAVADYLGPRFIVWQKGFDKSELQAELRGDPLIQTGGSVATCLLDLLVWMGSRKIALVGQDLAFSNGYSHAEGTHGARKVDMDNLLEVPDYFQQGKIGTSKNLFVYLKWFERYNRSLISNVELWNCTEGGAFIPGWIHKSLQEFVNFE
jgi:hypothetical protein